MCERERGKPAALGVERRGVGLQFASTPRLFTLHVRASKSSEDREIRFKLLYKKPLRAWAMPMWLRAARARAL